MRTRLPIILAITALIVALLGWTTIGQADPVTAKPAATPAAKVKTNVKVVSKKVFVPAAEVDADGMAWPMYRQVTVNCPSGWVRTGGGANAKFLDFAVNEPTGKRGWTAGGWNWMDTPEPVTAKAVCIKVR